MNRRFFSSQKIVGSRIQLATQEAHHLLHVLRAELGSEWTVFDDSGWEFRVRLIGVAKSHAELEVIDRIQVDRESATWLQLAVAFPKGDRQKWLIEKCVELGVGQLTPLNSQRSVVKLSAASISKFERYIVESSKQCGRNRLMEVRRPVDFEDFIGEVEVPDRWIAHPDGRLVSQQISEIGSALAVVVGPEGGFTDEEAEFAASHGWLAVSLGSRILRIETAAVAIAAVVGLRGEG